MTGPIYTLYSMTDKLSKTMSIQFIFQVLHSANIYPTYRNRTFCNRETYGFGIQDLEDASKKMIYTHGVLIFSQRGIIIKISGCYNK